MNNILPFPAPPRMAQQPAQAKNGQGQAARTNPMQIIMDQFMHGIQPEQILDQMAGPEVMQARQIIHGKNSSQLRSIAINMAQQRGVKIEDLASQLGVKLPK